LAKHIGDIQYQIDQTINTAKLLPEI